jgi:ABC-type multidrug transport system ATPase subunit
MTVVETRDLTKSFGDVGVLEDVDVTAEESEVTLLMGPNGTGKTILLSCLVGGLHPDSGEVSVFGGAPAEARRRLSFMLQDGLLVKQLTGKENVSFFQDLHPRATGRWREILDRLQFDVDALDREVRNYSGGMKRKLELAITLSVDVPLYVLDEPTAALDVTTVDRLHGLLSELREAGKTIVMSSHLPGDARLADQVAFVRGGEVVVQGRPEHLVEAVPPVVHVEGVQTDLDEYLIDGRLFEGGDGSAQRRGFLRDGVDPSTIEDAPEDSLGRSRVAEPSVTDLFNYYVHVR